MKKTRFAVKALAASLTATLLVLGSMSAPAQARDTGWGPVSVTTQDGPKQNRDTGWGPV